MFWSALLRGLLSRFSGEVARAVQREAAESRGKFLTFRSDPKEEVVMVDADHVLELWYDYNPFGWQHANSWQVVYLSDGAVRNIRVYDQDHLKKPFGGWLSRNFPAHVGATFKKMYGYPGGDDSSLLVWSRNTEDASNPV